MHGVSNHSVHSTEHMADPNLGVTLTFAFAYWRFWGLRALDVGSGLWILDFGQGFGGFGFRV